MTLIKVIFLNCILLYFSSLFKKIYSLLWRVFVVPSVGVWKMAWKSVFEYLVPIYKRGTWLCMPTIQHWGADIGRSWDSLPRQPCQNDDLSVQWETLSGKGIMAESDRGRPYCPAVASICIYTNTYTDIHIYVPYTHTHTPHIGHTTRITPKTVCMYHLMSCPYSF